MTPQAFSIDTLLERVAAEDASDLHVTAGSPPLLRMRGRLAPLEEFEAFTPEETRDLLYRVLSTDQQKRLEIDRQIDFSYSRPGRRPLPRQRLLPARHARRRLPPRAEADQVGRRSSAFPRCSSSSHASRAASSS